MNNKIITLPNFMSISCEMEKKRQMFLKLYIIYMYIYKRNTLRLPSEGFF